MVIKHDEPLPPMVVTVVQLSEWQSGEHREDLFVAVEPVSGEVMIGRVEFLGSYIASQPGAPGFPATAPKLAGKGRVPVVNSDPTKQEKVDAAILKIVRDLLGIESIPITMG